MLAILPLVVTSLGSPDDTVVTTSPRAAQVRLADLLADADEIDGARAHEPATRAGQTITFAIVRGDEPCEIVATTNAGGEVVGVVLRDRVASDRDLGTLSWLADSMKQTVAVTKLDVDEDGAVTLITADGQRYIVIPGRGSGGPPQRDEDLPRHGGDDGDDDDDGGDDTDDLRAASDTTTAAPARFAAQVASDPRG